MNLSDEKFLWSISKNESKSSDSSFMSGYPYTSFSPHSTTSMDSGHDSPLHTSNVQQNMTEQSPNFYNTGFQSFGNSMGNTAHYHNMSQTYNTPFPSPSISASSDLSTSYCATYNIQAPPSVMEGPKLQIIEEPKTIFRFRYETEMQGPHGMIQAKKHSKNEKVYPTVKLINAENYDERTKFMIKCSLYQYEPNENASALHPHKLIMRSGDIENCDPHFIEVSKKNNYTAVFQGLGIIQTKKDNMRNVIYQKIKSEMQHEQNRELSEEENKVIIADAEKLIKKVNINQVRLGYTAFMRSNYDNAWIKISGPILSTVINNKKSGKVGDLKICRMSSHVSEADGNQEIFMFVSKVDKNTIKVRFFETEDGEPFGRIKWEDYGRFQPSDVHHQFGIVFKTPPYKDKTIESNVDVFIQLLRSSDNEKSEAHTFTYKRNSNNGSKRKRQNDDTIVYPTVIQPFNESTSGDFSSSSNQSTFTSQSYSNQPQMYDINQNTQHHRQCQNQHNEPQSDSNFMLSFIADIELSSIFSANDSDFEEYILSNDFKLIDPNLATDAPKSIRQESFDVNFSILEKLKMIIKLFKEKYDDDKIHEMMMVLIKASEERDENLLIDVIQYGTMNDIKELVLILVKYKLFNVFKSKNEIDQNALHLAINLGYLSLIKVLIKFGVDVNAVDAFGLSPLHLAVQRNNQAIVEELLSSTKSIILNEFDDNGNTPLILSALNNNLEIAKTLIRYGADLSKRNPSNGYTCLHIALLNENVNKDLIGHLIESDRNVLTLESHDGMNAMELATENRLPSDVMDLLSSFYGDDKKEIFDEQCLRELCEIFDKNNSWKIWLARMDMAAHIKHWIHSPSPSKEVFQYLINTKKTLHDFIELLDLTDDDERERALNAIDEMVVRQFSK